MMAPAVGLLWTPGYWGPQVGFYGGVNYGYGYGGVGFGGGRWNGGNFNYNTAVMRVNTARHSQHVYRPHGDQQHNSEPRELQRSDRVASVCGQTRPSLPRRARSAMDR